MNAKMPNSSTIMDQKWLRDLATALATIDRAEDAERFLEEICTPAERRNLVLRWKLMQMLRDGIPQRKIAERLGISLCKITRGSKILKDSGTITSQLLNYERKGNPR